MTKAIYSFGEESPLKFEISDKLAERYNQAADQMFKAQRRFNQKFGRNWNPSEKPIRVQWSSKQRWAWNEMADLLAKMVEEQGPFHPNDFMDDFLVKNAGSASIVANKKWGRILSVGIAVGVLYGLLGRR